MYLDPRKLKVFPQTESRSQTNLTNNVPGFLLAATLSAGSTLSLQGNHPTCLTGTGRLAELSIHPSLALSVLGDFLSHCHMRNRAGQETRYQLHSVIWVWELFPSGVRNQLHVLEVKFDFNIEICHFQNELWSLRCLNTFLEDYGKWNNLGHHSPRLTELSLSSALPTSTKQERNSISIILPLPLPAGKSHSFSGLLQPFGN